MSRNSYAQWNGNGTMKSTLYDDYPCYAAPDFSSTLEKPPIPVRLIQMEVICERDILQFTLVEGSKIFVLYLVCSLF
ncbi:hypothetical protein L596_011089 [Steinernema carpocapsae]|uniref:Uncharacterized protein n=1 Tax=Steinernema carpocapsae TaxID=34508 RepID=A0A4U5NSE4_STECR|nr:hypothetical protein L596_011089 [Steinernema carpocapsae]